MNQSFKECLRRFPGMDAMVGLYRYMEHQSALRHALRTEPLRPDIPPPHLRYRVHRSFDIDAYLATGREVAAAVSDAFHRAGLEMKGCDVLDLGSGPGRVARWLKAAHPSIQLTCVDIDGEAVDWGRTHAAEVAHFVKGEPHPPGNFASRSFDAVYCISLFTHLDEPMQDAWLGEIKRLLKPGGFLLATTHGEYAIASCSASELDLLHRRGIVFRRTGKRRIKLDGLPGFYQTAFHTRDYVLAHWAKTLEVVSYLPGGIQHHQDIVVLRRPEE